MLLVHGLVQRLRGHGSGTAEQMKKKSSPNWIHKQADRVLSWRQVAIPFGRLRLLSRPLRLPRGAV